MMSVIQHAWVSFVLSVAETLILYWLCSNFLHRNLRPMSQYTVGILIYFIFQWVTYWFNAPLFSMCVFYCAFTMLVSCIFFTDSLRTKVLVAYLFVVLNYACKLLSAVLLRFLHNEPLPSEPNFLIQSPLAQMTACILFLDKKIIPAQSGSGIKVDAIVDGSWEGSHPGRTRCREA